MIVEDWMKRHTRKSTVMAELLRETTELRRSLSTPISIDWMVHNQHIATNNFQYQIKKHFVGGWILNRYMTDVMLTACVELESTRR